MLLHFAFLCTVLITSTSGWKNQFDQPLNFQCPNRQHISQVISEHSNDHEDRRWDYGCRNAWWISTSGCIQSDYINVYDQEYFSYQCGAGTRVVTGFQSEHNNRREDRRWKVKCCRVVGGVNQYNCDWTGYVNQYDGYMDYRVPAGMAITGVQSEYNSHDEDGVWKFRICRFEDVNECLGSTHGCQHICENNLGSFTCSCRAGYMLDTDGKQCRDVNECLAFTHGCQHICKNNAGSFTCLCRAGYTLDTDGKRCYDVNECLGYPHGCQHICENNMGSFTCSCRAGYTLDVDRKHCHDIDECQNDNGRCTQECNNSPGSYSCSCRSGYRLHTDQQTCLDINECLTSNGGCSHRCKNTIGSYICSCKEIFYQLGGDGKSCFYDEPKLIIAIVGIILGILFVLIFVFGVRRCVKGPKTKPAEETTNDTEAHSNRLNEDIESRVTNNYPPDKIPYMRPADGKNTKHIPFERGNPVFESDADYEEVEGTVGGVPLPVHTPPYSEKLN